MNTKRFPVLVLLLAALCSCSSVEPLAGAAADAGKVGRARAVVWHRPFPVVDLVEQARAAGAVDCVQRVDVERRSRVFGSSYVLTVHGR